MPGAWRGATSPGGVSVHVEGLAELQRAFRRIGGDLPRNTRRALREIAKPVQKDARSFDRDRSGALDRSIKIGVTARAVSVYTNIIYGRVQDQGGRVGRNHATLLARGSVSQYMTRAQAAAPSHIEPALEQLGDRIADEFQR